MLVDLVRGDSAHRPSRPLPGPLLASVLTHVEVERPAVDFKDQPSLLPAQVGFLARDAHVQPRERPPSVPQDLKRSNLGAASGALEGQPGVPGDRQSETTGSAPASISTKSFPKLVQRDLFEAHGL